MKANVYKPSSDFAFERIKNDFSQHNCTTQQQTPHSIDKLECGPMPNVMVALPNIGGALCSTPQSLDDAHD